MRRLRVGLTALLLIGGGPAGARPDDARVLADHLERVFAERYAPAALKERTLGWRLPEQMQFLRKHLAASRSGAETRVAFRRFFRSLRDLHTSIAPADTRTVWLGVQLASTNRGVRVAWVEPSLHLPLQVGDEVTALDGLPIGRARAGIAEGCGYRSTPDSERAFADWFLTLRSSGDLDRVPQAGTSTRLKVRGHGTIALPWLEFNGDTACPFWPKAKRSVLPEPPSVEWRAPESATWQAYAFTSAGRHYGFIRLHTYDLPPDRQRQALVDFDAAIDAFHSAEGLIIDQRGNAGGNFLLADAMLSRLGPLVPTPQRFLVRGAEVVGFGDKEELGTLSATLAAPRSDEGARAAMDAIPLFANAFSFGPRDLATALSSADFFGFFAGQSDGLTTPHAELIDHFRARGPLFTGRVVMLIDGLALSAGDFAPATLQDAGRATLFGTTTAGAGGDQRHVGLNDECGTRPSLLSVCAPRSVLDGLRRLGFSGYSYTVTLGVRPGGRVIENRGVTPDVRYDLTLADLQSGFAPMRAKLLETLERG